MKQYLWIGNLSRDTSCRITLWPNATGGSLEAGVVVGYPHMDGDPNYYVGAIIIDGVDLRWTDGMYYDIPMDDELLMFDIVAVGGIGSYIVTIQTINPSGWDFSSGFIPTQDGPDYYLLAAVEQRPTGKLAIRLIGPKTVYTAGRFDTTASQRNQAVRLSALKVLKGRWARKGFKIREAL
jgi:hypothetical protein